MRRGLRWMFGRPVRTVVSLMVQVAVFCAAMRLCSEAGGIWLRAGLRLISWVAVVAIVSGNGEMGYRMAWSILVLAVPVFGLMCYALLGASRKNRRLCELHTQAAAYLETHLHGTGALPQLMDEAPSAGVQARAIHHLGGAPVYYGGQTKWFAEGEPCFRAMLEDLRHAEKSIWLEYFIIRPGVMWDSILRILRQKAAHGVDVRVIYDDFGCLGLPRNYPRTLEKQHIQCCVFNPFTPELPTRLGSRDHRKLLLIDGNLCYTGGMNLADEYVGLRMRFGHWKDGAVRVEGTAVYAFSALFLSMWSALRGTAADAPPIPEGQNGSYCYLQPLWDSPLHRESVGRSAIVGAISRAEHSVWLMSPYFVPDDALCRTLCLAAASGIDVKIITPGIGDKWYAQALTRAHYPRLFAAGVEIYEYRPGFLHSKVCCVDGEIAVIGTVNLDYRSFYLQFEDGLWLYGRSAAAEIAEDFAATMRDCEPVHPTCRKQVSWPRRAGRAILRLFAPLL